VTRLDWRVWYQSTVLLRRLSAAALVTAVLALPAVALADSAGDNQYQDPFSNVPTHPKQKKNSGSGATTTPAPAPAPAPPSTTTPSSSSAGAPSTNDPAGTLPRTGFPLLPVAAVGAALVAAGLGLRRLVSDR
jgi:hypothetical protein